MSPSLNTREARRTLGAVLDEIVPAHPGGTLPGAGALGLADYVEERLADAAPVVAAGLAALEQLARESGAAEFATAEARPALLSEVAASQPGWLESLTFHTYTGYYQHPRVLEALGLEARPPHPEGYPLEPGDLSGLERVRARGQLYRDAE